MSGALRPVLRSDPVGMNRTSVLHRPTLSNGPRMAASGPVSVLVAAVSDRHVMLCADGIYVTHAGVRYNEHKVFRGPDLVAGVVGTMDAAAGSIGSAVATASAEPTIAAFISTLQASTASWLQAAYLEWRAAFGPAMPVAAFATVLVGGHLGGQPAAVELTVALNGAGQLQWTAPAPLSGPPGETYIGAWGIVDDQLLAATTVYPQAVALGLHPGHVPPATRPPAGIADQDLFDHVRALVSAAIGREPALPRPASWPAGVPVIGGEVWAVAI